MLADNLSEDAITKLSYPNSTPLIKVENILGDSLDLILSPSVKIQIIAGKVHLR